MYAIRSYYVSLIFLLSKKRMLYFAFGIIIFLISYSIGAEMKLTPEDAENIKKEFKDRNNFV